jgi:hypothetical protein
MRTSPAIGIAIAIATLGSGIMSGTAFAAEPSHAPVRLVAWSEGNRGAATPLNPEGRRSYFDGFRVGFDQGRDAGLRDAKQDCRRHDQRRNNNRSFNRDEYERGFAAGFDRGYTWGYDRNERRFCHRRR